MQKLEARPHNTQTTGLPNFQSRRRLAKSCVRKRKSLASSAMDLKIQLFSLDTKTNTVRHADYNNRGKEKNTTRKRIQPSDFCSMALQNYDRISLTPQHTSSEI